MPAMTEPFAFVPTAPGRSGKPRRRGLTMMIDAGLPLGATGDLLALGADYIDLAKIKTGTARLYPEAALVKKLKSYKAHAVRPFIGGQFHEYVFATLGAEALPRFYDEAKRLGFEAIEISDNVVPLTDAERKRQISAAVASGLVVFGEVGSKETLSDPSLLIGQAALCLEAGAELVLVEAAELVRDGRPDERAIETLANGVDMARVMIELPGPWIHGVRRCDIEDMKKYMIRVFGPDVNLANVPPDGIIDLEADRVGLGVAGPPTVA